jgi:aryl-alcohol dehydrogenase-like predicted oxidoreductase
MEYRQLGTSEIQVSVVGLGGNTFGPPRIDEQATKQAIHAALDLGVNFVDTADAYGQGESETYIGNALRGQRDRVVIGTKFNFHNLKGTSPEQRLMTSAEASMRKLQTDYIDLLQLHMPDDIVRTEELLLALDRLVRAGKVRAIGASNYSSWRLAESAILARTLGTAQFATIQNHYSLLHRHPEQEVLQACHRYGVSMIPYHPLAGGLLTGKYGKGEPPPPGTRGAAGSPIISRMSTDRNWEIVADLREFASARGHTIGELAIAWLTANDAVASVIAGVSNVEQVNANVAGSLWQLSVDDVALLNKLASTGAEEPAEPNLTAGSPRPTPTRTADSGTQA